MVTSTRLSLLASVFVYLILKLGRTGGSSVGVCYGMLSDNLPPERDVVALYRSHNFGKMRLYDPNPSALRALRGSGIEVLVGVRNQDLQQLGGSYSAANNWVQKNIRAYWPAVKFRYIAVGNEVIPGSYAKFVLPAMKNIYYALRSRGLHTKIKVSTSVATSVMGNSYPPSVGAFSNSSKAYMGPIAQFLASSGSPLLANVYPYFSYVANPRDISLAYALFAARSDMFRDGKLGYRNLFDATVDALYAALEKAGAPQVTVVVSETGWPSGGNGNGANIRNALMYNWNLIRHVSSTRGTPKRPGKSIEAYVFAMFNEDRKQGGIEQHFGLFYPNKRQVYPIPI